MVYSFFQFIILSGSGESNRSDTDGLVQGGIHAEIPSNSENSLR